MFKLLAVIGMLCVASVAQAQQQKQKQGKNTDIETCRRLANEKLRVQDGRALNRGSIRAAVQRCKERGPSAI